MSANQIVAKLNEVFENLDANFLEGQKRWAANRKQALIEFKKSEAYANTHNVWQLYDMMYSICGGKTWFRVFNENGTAAIEKFVEKNCEAVVAKRNAKIAAKLEKAGVTEVLSEEFTHSNDGFNGVFVVGTDSGTKRVTVDTIVAGGYNVQCMHMRTLVKVK